MSGFHNTTYRFFTQLDKTKKEDGKVNKLKATGGEWSAKDFEIRSTCCPIELAKVTVFNEGRANAHLMASAPELYEALVWAMRFVDQVRIESPLPKDSGEDISYRYALEALAKARGE